MIPQTSAVQKKCDMGHVYSFKFSSGPIERKKGEKEGGRSDFRKEGHRDGSVS